MKIYVFGNQLIDEDSVPLKISPKLKKIFPDIKFIQVDPNENFPDANEKDLVIIDTVKGLKKICLIQFSDLEMIKKSPVSPHDYDLLFHLQLLMKLGKVNSVMIIGLPYLADNTGEDIEFAVTKVKKIISTLL